MRSIDANGASRATSPFLDPEYLRRYEDLGIPVHIDAGQKSTLERPVPIF